jgi:predicted RNA-binding protein with RPS1 domain
VTLRGTNRVLVQVLRRKLSVKLPLHLKSARHHPRAVRNRDSPRAAIRGSRLHQPERELKKQGLQRQRGKQRQQSDDGHSSESKHRFHVCSPEVRWAMRLFAVANRKQEATPI